MRRATEKATYIGWVAASLFGAITAVVLIASEPAYSAFCASYSDKSCLAGLIYDYQTLLTGILALAAAGLTIQRMRKDDKSASERHLQQMQLSRRPDRLRLERHVLPWLHELKRTLELLQELRESEVENPIGMQSRSPVGIDDDRYLALPIVISDLEKLAIREDWQHINDLVDYPITRARSDMIDGCRACQRSYFEMLQVLNAYVGSLNSDDTDGMNFESAMIAWHQTTTSKEFADAFRSLCNVTSELHIRLTQLLRMYDVEVH